jgi:hypothetical protein
VRIRSFVSAMLAGVIGLAMPVFASAPTPTTGKLVFTFTVTLDSFVPYGAFVMCTVTAKITETSGQSVTQQAIGIATRVKGVETCVATMPYSWELETPGSDTIDLSYTVELDHAYQAIGYKITPVTEILSDSKVTQNLESIPVPANGATTNEAISPTI